MRIGTASCLLLAALAGGQRAEAVQPSPFVEHVFSPTATQPCTPDPAVPCIDPALADHHAWFNPAATNNQLLVYLPGTGDVPANALLFQQLGADLGYHVIGLMYEDGNFIAALCRNDPDPDACFFNARFEVVYGADTSTKLQVSPTNSVVNLLTKSLRYLAATYPDEGWSPFLINSELQWSQIALSGFSQGSGNAVMIARHSVVPRVVMLSGIPDRLPLGPEPCRGPASWMSTHATPSARYWGIAHDQDSFYYPHICANWVALGMSAFGPLVQVETSEPPYAGTHMLITDLKPHEGPHYTYAHQSTAFDRFTPHGHGEATLTPAWTYALTASEE